MLNARETLFVQHMLILNNGTRAARAAGYSPGNCKAAAVTAARLLSRAKIQTALRAARAEISAKLDISAERTLTELASVAYTPVEKLTDSGKSSKVKALDQLMRHLGLYREDNSQKGDLGDLVAALQAGRDRVRGRS
jgi:hypothetical protein